MAGQNLAVHESLDLHELLTLKTVCAAKSAAMQEMVSSPELKSLLQQDEQSAKEHIRELQNLLQAGTTQH